MVLPLCKRHNLNTLTMEQPIVTFTEAEYIQTAKGNKVARKSVLCGSKNISLLGKAIVQAGCVIRGDMAQVLAGKFCVVKQGVLLRPSWKHFPKGDTPFNFFPMKLGDYVTIDENAVVGAATIESHVHIGANCVISPRCVLLSCCKIEPNTFLPPDTVVPPFAIMAGNPGRQVGELPEATKELHVQLAKEYYSKFQPE
eukprot:m.106292 g.106292  ORF g.106292 m.106292 type:complete len:198 (-) comp13297_c0_seq1:44-637(-)